MRRHTARLVGAAAAAVTMLVASAGPAHAYPRWSDPPYPDPPYFCTNGSPMWKATFFHPSNDPTVANNPEQNTFWGMHPNPGYDYWFGRWYGDFRGSYDDDSGWHYLFRVPYPQHYSWNFSDYGWSVHGHVTQYIAYYNPTFGGQCGYGAYGNAWAPPYMADVIGYPVVDIYVDTIPPWPPQPRVSSVTPSSVSFTWDPVADRGDGGGRGYWAAGMSQLPAGYTAWATVNGGAPQQQGKTLAPRTISLTGLQRGDRACVSVYATDAVGNSGSTQTVCASPLSPPPPPAFQYPPTTIHVNPSPSGLVGFDSWFWLDPLPQAVTSTEASGGYQYTVTATPQTTTWYFGDGGSQQEADPAGYGMPYPQPSTVAWTYQAQAQGYEVRAVETYSLSWTAQSGGVTYGPNPMGSQDGPQAEIVYPVQQAQPELLR